MFPSTLSPNKPERSRILAPSTSTRWFYVENGRRRGPVQLDELIELLLHDRLSSDTPVWHTGLAEWVKAATVPEIAAELPPPMPAVERPSAVSPPSLPPLDLPSAEALPPSGQPAQPDEASEDSLTEVVPVPFPEVLIPRHLRRRRRRHRTRGREPRWDLLAILAVALIVLVAVLWRMFRQGDAIPSGIVGLG